MLEQLFGILLGIAISLIILFLKGKKGASTTGTTGSATGGTGTRGTGTTTEAERRQREEEERIRRQEEARRQRSREGTSSTGTRSSGMKYKEKPPEEHRQNVGQWENIKRSYQSGKINFFRMLMELKNTTWINGLEPDVKLVQDVINFIIGEFDRHSVFLYSKTEFTKIKRGISLIFYPDYAGKKDIKIENQAIHDLYVEIMKSFNVFFDDVEGGRWTPNNQKLRQDIGMCFK